MTEKLAGASPAGWKAFWMTRANVTMAGWSGDQSEDLLRRWSLSAADRRPIRTNRETNSEYGT